jgi:hypothetical protein
MIFSRSLGPATENSSSKSESSTLGVTSRTDNSTLGLTSRTDSGHSKVLLQEEEDEFSEMSPLIENDEDRSNRTTSGQSKTEVRCLLIQSLSHLTIKYFVSSSLNDVKSNCGKG